MSDKAMSQLKILATSPFHTISRVEVPISSNPQDEEVYRIGSAKIGGKWQALYTLTKLGINKIMTAAGVETLETTVEEIAPQVWRASYTGKYIRPDATEYIDTRTKVIDLRVGGARWRKEVEKNLDTLVAKWAQAKGIQMRSGERKEEFAIRAKVELETTDQETYKRAVKLAEERATRYTTQAAQFGAELAESGAVNRFARTIFQLGKYTEAQLREPFVIFRARFDFSAFQAAAGQSAAQRFLLESAKKSLGLDLDVTTLLEAESTASEKNIWEAAVLPDTYKDLTDILTEKGLRDTYHRIFGRPHSLLTEGEARVLLDAIPEYDMDDPDLCAGIDEKIREAVNNRKPWTPDEPIQRVMGEIIGE